jgi:hypothetical protein
MSGARQLRGGAYSSVHAAAPSARRRQLMVLNRVRF